MPARKKYKILVQRWEHRAGAIVYKSGVNDYGCANLDSRTTGVEHVSVTYDPEGGYPVFTIPKDHLAPVEEDILQ